MGFNWAFKGLKLLKKPRERAFKQFKWPRPQCVKIKFPVFYKCAGWGGDFLHAYLPTKTGITFIDSMIYALFFEETAQSATQTKAKNGNWNQWNSNSVHSCVAMAKGDFANITNVLQFVTWRSKQSCWMKTTPLNDRHPNILRLQQNAIYCVTIYINVGQLTI